MRQYFEGELDAFYYMLFPPVARITEHMPKHGAITRKGEYRVLSELTGFVVYFLGYTAASCAISIKLFEADRTGCSMVNGMTLPIYLSRGARCR